MSDKISRHAAIMGVSRDELLARLSDPATDWAALDAAAASELPTTCYATMTVAGSYGSSFDALDDDDAIAQAERAGYDVLDVTDHAGVPTLVIAE